MPTKNPPQTASQRAAAQIRARMSHDKRASAELAELLNLSTWSVSRRINGHHAFKIDELQTIAEWLGVPLETIALDTAEDRTTGTKSAH